MQALRELQLTQTATFSDAGVPLSFGDDRASWQAAQTQVAMCDRSHGGVIAVSDGDRLRFLHNQTTNQFEGLTPGAGCETVFVTSTARTMDLATAYVTADSVLLLPSPGQAEALIAWMDQYIFFADRVKLANLSSELAIFNLIGPTSTTLLQTLIDAPLPATPHHHITTQIGGHTVQLAAGSGLALPGYTVMVAADLAAPVWQSLTTAGAVPTGDAVWEQLRLTQGRPAPGAELTDAINPLEAGLWHTISFEKGCYIGQETIARLQTYQGVKQQLWGLTLDQLPTDLTLMAAGETKPAGQITSWSETPLGLRGLGYVRTKLGGVGLTLQAGDATVQVHDLPYLTHGYLTPT